MKRIAFLVVTMTALCTAPAGRAQDAATEQRLNELSGKIEELLAGQESMKKHLDALGKEIENVREQCSKPTGNYASLESVSRLADAVREVDRKRLDDYEKIRTELVKLGRTLAAPVPVTPKSRSSSSSSSDRETGGPEKSPVSDKGYEHVVQKGDTLSIIIQAYREKNIKVTMDQILKANPGLKPEKLRVGQKIFIPAPLS